MKWTFRYSSSSSPAPSNPSILLYSLIFRRIKLQLKPTVHLSPVLTFVPPQINHNLESGIYYFHVYHYINTICIHKEYSVVYAFKINVNGIKMCKYLCIFLLFSTSRDLSMMIHVAIVYPF